MLLLEQYIIDISKKIMKKPAKKTDIIKKLLPIIAGLGLITLVYGAYLCMNVYLYNQTILEEAAVKQQELVEYALQKQLLEENLEKSTENNTKDTEIGEEEKHYSAYIFTDKALYLPGETVHMQSVLKKLDDFSISEGQEIYITLYNGKGKELYNKLLTLTEFGSTAALYKLGEKAGYGTYTIILKKAEEVFGKIHFDVGIVSNRQENSQGSNFGKDQIVHSTEMKSQIIIETNKEMYSPSETAELSLSVVGESGIGKVSGVTVIVTNEESQKKTLYIDTGLVTDESGKVETEFILPDTPGKFGISAISYARDKTLGYGEKKIDTHKNVYIENHSPAFYRTGDSIELSIDIVNKTTEEVSLEVAFESEDIQVNKPKKSVVIPAGESSPVTFWTGEALDVEKDVHYKFLVSEESGKQVAETTGSLLHKEYGRMKTSLSNGGMAQLEKVQSMSIEIPENIDLKQSKVNIHFSNNVSLGIEQIQQAILQGDDSSVQSVFAKFYSDNTGKKSEKIIAEKAGENAMQLIELYELKTGGFGYWKEDAHSDIGVMAFILEGLYDLEKNGYIESDELITRIETYLRKNVGTAESDLRKTQAFYALSRGDTSDEMGADLFTTEEREELSQEALIYYTYGLLLTDKSKYSEEITENITDILETFSEGEKKGEKQNMGLLALFASLLMEQGTEKSIIDSYIEKLYATNWENSVYSSKTQLQALRAFVEYAQKYGSSGYAKFAFSVGTIQNREKRFEIGGTAPDSFEREFMLNDILQYKEDHIELTSYVLGGEALFTNLSIELHIEDPLEIISVDQGISVEKEIFKILNKDSEGVCLPSEKDDENCEKIYEATSSWALQNGEEYIVSIELILEADIGEKRIVLEDSLPASFTIISGIEESLNWDHIEYIDESIRVHGGNFKSNKIYLNYRVRAEYEGKYMVPPASAYILDESGVSGSSAYEKIVVEK